MFVCVCVCDLAIKINVYIQTHFLKYLKKILAFKECFSNYSSFSNNRTLINITLTLSMF